MEVNHDLAAAHRLRFLALAHSLGIPAAGKGGRDEMVVCGPVVGPQASGGWGRAPLKLEGSGGCGGRTVLLPSPEEEDVEARRRATAGDATGGAGDWEVLNTSWAQTLPCLLPGTVEVFTEGPVHEIFEARVPHAEVECGIRDHPRTLRVPRGSEEKERET